MIKAIETVYNGYRFRSRLEARWAVFFDTLGIKYEYEKEGYDLDGTWYLPDFWLPKHELWVEIKGGHPTESEMDKAAKLTEHTHKRTSILWGNIKTDHNSTYSFALFKTGKAGMGSREEWCECPICGEIGLASPLDFPPVCLCPYKLRYMAPYDLYPVPDTPRLIKAYTAARQARFEHGEKG